MGCKTAEESSGVKEKKTIVSVALWGDQLMEGYAPYLQEQFPEVEFEFYVATNSTDYYRFRHEKEALADIMTVRRFSLNDVKSMKDDLMDLSDTELANTFYQAYLRNYTYDDGTVNWLPACAEVDSLILNKTLFEENQIPIPTDYASFLAACEQFEALGIQGFASDYVNDFTCMELLQGLSAKELTSADGRRWRQDYESGKEAGLDREVWMPVFDKMQDFIEHMQLQAENTDDTITEVLDKFEAGKLAMYRGTGADVLRFREAGEPLLMPYFGDDSEDNWYLTYPAFQAAAKKTEDSEREKLILDIMSCMLSEKGLEQIATGQNMVAYNKGVQLELLPELENLNSYIEDNRLFVRLASSEMFAVSKEVVHKMMSGELESAESAYEYFDARLREEEDKETADITIEKGYDYSFDPESGSEAASALANSVREETGAELLLCQASDVAGEIRPGAYQEQEVGYILRGESLRVFHAEMTGQEIKAFLNRALEKKGQRGCVVNDSNLYVSSGFEMEIQKEKNGYTVEKLTVQGKPMKQEQVYHMDILSGEHYFAGIILPELGIDYTLQEETVKELIVQRLVGERKQLAEPTDYITLQE